MKRLVTFTFILALLFGLGLTQSTYAQQDPSGAGKKNQGQIRPNFVDEDGDGICDNNKGGTGTRTGKMNRGKQGKGKGQGQGTGTGARLHKQLRDGSCTGGTSTRTSQGTSSTGSNKRGNSRSAAPTK